MEGKIEKEGQLLEADFSMKLTKITIRLDEELGKILKVKMKVAGMKNQSDYIRSCIRHSDATKIQNAVEVATKLAEAVNRINLNCIDLRIRIDSLESKKSAAKARTKILKELNLIESNAFKEVAKIGNTTCSEG